MSCIFLVLFFGKYPYFTIFVGNYLCLFSDCFKFGFRHYSRDLRMLQIRRDKRDNSEIICVSTKGDGRTGDGAG